MRLIPLLLLSRHLVQVVVWDHVVFLEAVKLPISAANDHVINERYSHQVTHTNESVGEQYVILARVELTLRMVMQHDHLGCIREDTALEQFPRMCQCVTQTPNTDEGAVNRCSVCFQVQYTHHLPVHLG